MMQVFKQKGEEYRITGQGGWYWVSVSRPSRTVPASSLGLRLVARKLEARKLKQAAAAGDYCDEKPLPMQLEQDEKPNVSDAISSEHDQTASESKPEFEFSMDADVSKTKTVKGDQQLEDRKESISYESGELLKTEAGNCKSEAQDDEFIDVNDTTENASLMNEEFSISEALISRMFYPRITKPYSKLDTFLDRRLVQFTAEQKQRLLCEQLIAQYRTQEADNKKPLSESGKPDVLNEGDLDVTEDADNIVKPDSSSVADVDSGLCYSALCRSITEAGHNSACYSPICRLHNYAKPALEQSPSSQTMDSNVELAKEDAIKTQSTENVQDRSAQKCNVAGDISGVKTDILLPKVQSDPNPIPSGINSLPADAMQNCMTSTGRSRSRVSRKKVSTAIAASRNKSCSSSEKAAPSLSLQKYTQDGKIHLTAELVRELEEALAMCGKTQHKVSLVRRAGPGRPPVKSVSRLSGVQKKVSLPPVHRFMSGRSSKRSLFALERIYLTKMARREGRWECPGFNYACKMTNVGWPYPCPRPFFRTAWRYRTQTLHGIAGAAVQLRVLWACIRWDDIKAHAPPGGTNAVTTDLDITTTELLKKRDLPPYGLRSEYLIRKIVVPISVPTTQPRGQWRLFYYWMICIATFI